MLVVILCRTVGLFASYRSAHRPVVSHWPSATPPDQQPPMADGRMSCRSHD